MLTFQEVMVLMAFITSVAGLITTVAELISAVISRRDSWCSIAIPPQNVAQLSLFRVGRWALEGRNSSMITSVVLHVSGV